MNNEIRDKVIYMWLLLITLSIIGGVFYENYNTIRIKEENKKQDSLFLDLYYSIVDTFEKDAYLVTLTTYNATEKQTDSSPYLTSAQYKIDKQNPFTQRYIGLSRDLLEEFYYGEIVILENAGIYNGYYLVADCMNSRFIRSIDILIGDKQKHTKLKNVVIKHANKN